MAIMNPGVPPLVPPVISSMTISRNRKPRPGGGCHVADGLSTSIFNESASASLACAAMRWSVDRMSDMRQARPSVDQQACVV